MLLSLSRAKPSPIAVDFGADSLKLLQIIPGEPPALVAAAAAVIPDHARFDAASRFAFLGESLRALLKSQPFKGRRAILSIPSFQTITQNLEINVGEHEDLDAQVGLHLQQRLNIDPNRMVVRHFNVPRAGREAGNRREVVCIAAPRDAVMRYIDIARRAKLDVVGMHSEPMAILQAFRHVHRRSGDAERALCFMDIGAATTKVVISHGPEMVFAKTIDAAGDQFTRHYAARRQIEFGEAREARIAEAAGGEEEPAIAQLASPGSGSAGLSTLDGPAPLRRRGAVAAALADDEEDDAGGDTPAPLAPLRPKAAPAPAAAVSATATSPAPAQPKREGGRHDETLDCLIDELQLCARYHQAQFPDKQIEKLIFLGGEARHVKTCQAMARALRTAAQLGDPFARLTHTHKPKKPAGVDLDQPQPGWAVAMGLCLSDPNL